jgi:UDP-N-acetylmuramoyl-L-alanyl-D-glutamate--2,6-diaminopimelate ligase
MQMIDEKQKFTCIVDFAHTPAALESTLRTLTRVKEDKLIVVFGSAGERDLAKRPMMGRIATQFADYSVITAEDPRNEDVGSIMNEIAKGATSVGGVENRTFWKIADRAEAIYYAIQTLAGENDIVVICGKGHEKSMNIGGQEIPWSDEIIARNALQSRPDR